MSAEPPRRGACFMCSPLGLPVDDVFEHMREHHPDLFETLQRWPDDEPVVIDRTLEPGDFA